jgi:uncharacterized protein YjiS (DUF1127 family)
LATLLADAKQEHPMPTQQTNLTSGTGRDPAVPGLAQSIALANGAMDGMFAPAPPNAALNGALPEKHSAAPAAASKPGVSGLLARCWHAFQERRRRQSLRASLSSLSDRELMDIGVTPQQIDAIAAHRAIEKIRNSTTYLWLLSRGVM